MSMIKYLFVTDFTEQEVFSTPVQGAEDQDLKQQALEIAQGNLKEEDRQFQHMITFKEKIFIIFALKNENQFLGVLVTLKSFQQHSLAFTCIQDTLEVITKHKNQEQQSSKSQIDESLEKIFEEFLDNIQNQQEKNIVVPKSKFKNEFLVDQQQIENFSDLQSQVTDDPDAYSELIEDDGQGSKGLFSSSIIALIFVTLAVGLCGVFYFAFLTNLIEQNLTQAKL